MSIVPGSTIGKFILESQLGGGGMGSVYKARDKALNRTVAIKVLNSQFGYDLENIERFEREARTLASLKHPNLMHVYDVGTEENNHYFAMEYIEGRSLKDMIEDHSRVISSKEALRITIEIMAGLQKVHDSGIVHRDIKPANIMIENTDGRAVLVDFGLSKSTSDSGLTSAGSILGTPDYISPEQIEGFEAGYASDIYSLGVVLYEMITGENPFTRDSAMQTIRAHCSYTPPILRKIAPRCSRELSRIVSIMIAVDPQNRYQSISALATDLLKVCKHPLLSRLAKPSTSIYIASNHSHEQSSRHKAASVKHYTAESPVMRTQFPLLRAALLGVGVLIVSLLTILLFLKLPGSSDSSYIPQELYTYNLPIVAYTPAGMATPPKGINNPSVIIHLKSGERIWGRVLNGLHKYQIAVGLFPNGQAEYHIKDVVAVINADSYALADKIPEANDLIKEIFPGTPSLHTTE